VRRSSVTLESLEAQQFQPVRMRAARQEFCRASAHPFGTLAAWKPAVVQVEPQEFQVVVADLPTQEEVRPQAAVEVLDQRTGPGRSPRRPSRTAVVRAWSRPPSW